MRLQQCKPWVVGAMGTRCSKAAAPPKPHTSARHLPESGVLGDTEYTRQEPCPQRLGHILETTRQQGGRWNMAIPVLLQKRRPLRGWQAASELTVTGKSISNLLWTFWLHILSICARRWGMLHLHYLLLSSE